MLTLLTGGARSGKSSLAQTWAERQPGSLLYVATAAVEDEEMAARVVRHRQQRGERWSTLEEPLWLADRLVEAGAGAGGIVVDCVTLWLSALLLHFREEPEPVLQQVDRLIERLPELPAPLWLVSNEVGSGIVPENRLARAFRDLNGEVNQKLAAAADQVFLVVSGLPLQLK